MKSGGGGLYMYYEALFSHVFVFYFQIVSVHSYFWTFSRYTSILTSCVSGLRYVVQSGPFHLISERGNGWGSPNSTPKTYFGSLKGG